MAGIVVEILGILSSRNATCADGWLTKAFLATTSASLTGMRVYVLVVATWTDRHASLGFGIEVGVYGAHCLGAVNPVVAWETVADSRHAVAVLGAPIRAGFAGVCAEISEDGAGETPRHRREGFLNARLRGEAGYGGSTHGEDDGIDPTDIRVATRSESGW